MTPPISQRARSRLRRGRSGSAKASLGGADSVSADKYRESGKGGIGYPVALFAGVLVTALGCLPVAWASLGSSHSCIALTDNTVKCWGDSSQGQLGLNDNVVRGRAETDMGDNLPVVPLGAFDAASVDCGNFFNCAVSVSGSVKCWGKNDFGQLGLEDNVTRGDDEGVSDMGSNLPRLDFGDDELVESLAVGTNHSCALLQRGLKCWGSNEAGQLGLGDSFNRGDDVGEMGVNLPYVDLGANVTVSSITAGHRHSCAVVDSGGVKCWGNNDGGQLGYDLDARGIAPNQMGDTLPFVDLGRGQRAITVAAGAYHSCALLYTGDVKCWGFGSDGQLGQGNNTSIGRAANSMGDNLPPIDLGTGRTAVAIAPGGAHTCAVLDNASIKCWGGNSHGSLGLGDTVSRAIQPGEMGDNLTAVDLTFGDGAGAVANAFAGLFHTCVSGTEGGLACFGLNSVGQLGTGTADNVGDEPGETNALVAIDFGTNGTALTPAAPGTGVALETVPPTAAPTPLPPVTQMPATVAPVARSPPGETTRMPVRGGVPTPGPTMVNGTLGGDTVQGGAESGDDSSQAGTTAAIVSAATLIPLMAVVALVCCWRRRQQKERGLKGAGSGQGSGVPVAGGGAAVAGGLTEMGDYRRTDSTSSSENNVEANADGTTEALATKPLVKANALQSTAPFGDSSALQGASVDTAIDESGEGLPRPKLSSAGPGTSGGASIAATSALAAAGTSAGARPSAASVVGSGAQSDDSSWGGASSDAEHPSQLRRSGSNSSISTLGSTSTASSTWPSDGFVTPARTDIARGGTANRYGARGRGLSAGNMDSFSAGLRTPASLAAATPNRTIPETPSPRSVSSSVHGTPHPPEMRLAQFARASTAGASDPNMYGLPEMEVGRSTSTVFDSNPAGPDPGWPVGSKGSAPLNAAASSAAAAVAPSVASADYTTDSSDNETAAASRTPAHMRHRSGGDPTAGDGLDGDARRKPGKKSRSGRKSGAASPADDGGVTPAGGAGWAEGAGGAFSAGGMGPEAAAAAFTEEAELEALQIDKDDLKLVFGRPFARGKSSEVYQVTHAGKNRAAKIIDLFSLGVVGEEVTRLYASFAQELRSMKGIRHDCVSAVYGAVATPSELTIVTDLVKRGPLRAVLDDKAKRENLSAGTRHRILKDMATGMTYLSEQGIQHRNLHSHNVLITKEWGAKVADYGLARTTEVMLGAHDRTAQSGGSSSTGSRKRSRSHRAGTLRWTAPELLQPAAESGDPFSEASDVYSLGVIAWEVLCGGSKLPYDGVTNDKVKSMILEGSTPPVSMETPIAYAKLMLLCWRKNPASRPTFSHISSVLLNEPPPSKA